MTLGRGRLRGRPRPSLLDTMTLALMRGLIVWTMTAASLILTHFTT